MKTHSLEWMLSVSGLSLMLLVGCSMDEKKEPKKVSHTLPILEQKVSFAPEDKKIEDKKMDDKKVEKKKMEKVELPVLIPNSTFVVAEELKPVYFDLQRSKLSETSLTTAKENAAWLKTQPPYLIAIVGVADRRGSTAHNRTLAERRAMNLKSVYVAEGIPAERMQIIAIGEDTQACPALDEECLKFSRRADTRLEQKALAQR